MSQETSRETSSQAQQAAHLEQTVLQVGTSAQIDAAQRTQQNLEPFKIHYQLALPTPVGEIPAVTEDFPSASSFRRDLGIAARWGVWLVAPIAIPVIASALNFIGVRQEPVTELKPAVVPTVIPTPPLPDWYYKPAKKV